MLLYPLCLSHRLELHIKSKSAVYSRSKYLTWVRTFLCVSPRASHLLSDHWRCSAQSGVVRVLGRYTSVGLGLCAGLHYHWIVGSELPSVCIPVLVHEPLHVCVALCVCFSGTLPAPKLDGNLEEHGVKAKKMLGSNRAFMSRICCVATAQYKNMHNRLNNASFPVNRNLLHWAVSRHVPTLWVDGISIKGKFP